MDANNEELAAKRKTLLVCGTIVGIFYLAAAAYVTQSIAADCGYNLLLGEFLSIGPYHVYWPLMYRTWMYDPAISKAIPDIINSYRLYPFGGLLLGAAIAYGVSKSLQVDISHGSASFATAKDIIKSDLSKWVTSNGGVFDYKKINLFKLFGHQFTFNQKKIKPGGVCIGINPFTNGLMLHDGPEHILLMAPTRSGKGVNTIIPTGITWKHSIFFFDPKCELWASTSHYRKHVLHQKVMKFEPLCLDGSANRWNPLAEINFRTTEEISDISTIVSVMVKPDGEKQGGGDPFWDNSAGALLNGVIMHLLYMHYKEELPLPCPTDIMSFLSSPDKDTDELFEDMMTYPHITPEEFLEEDGRENPLRKIYGNYYVKNLFTFNKALHLEGDRAVKDVLSLRDAIRAAIKQGKKIDWDTKDDEDIPFHRLLTHPRVAECAANMKNGAEATRASIMQTAQTALAVYQDPVVQRNTAVSDFCIRDLLDPRQDVSCYLCMQVKDLSTLRPIARLFINTVLNKLIRGMKFVDSDKQSSPAPAGKEKPKINLDKSEPPKKSEAKPVPKKEGKPPKKKQRLLLMLDEFPQLGNMKSVETALAICAGYGIKVCIVCQDVNQLNKEYTKDNSIASNCHLHIYFTPNLDTNGGATAKAISDNLGKKTIKSVSHSDGGGIGKGSDSTSSTGRELMTADEVSKLSTEEELVFIAGHKTIKGKKLRYYLSPYFMKRALNAKTNKNLPPKTSDKITRVETYEQLFQIYAAEKKEQEAAIADIQQELARIEKLEHPEEQEGVHLEKDEENKRTRIDLTKPEQEEYTESEESQESDEERTRSENSSEVEEAAEQAEEKRSNRGHSPVPMASHEQSAEDVTNPAEEDKEIQPISASQQEATEDEADEETLEITVDSFVSEEPEHNEVDTFNKKVEKKIQENEKKPETTVTNISEDLFLGSFNANVDKKKEQEADTDGTD